MCGIGVDGLTRPSRDGLRPAGIPSDRCRRPASFSRSPTGFGAALLFGYITQRLGLSPIVGYLLAGVVVGPNTPGFIADAHLAEQLAEIGVILLMFGVGLQFHLEELLAVRRIAIPGAIAQSGIAAALGAVAAHTFGWTWPASIVFGLALSVASTVVLVRVLSDSRQLHTAPDTSPSAGSSSRTC